MEVSAVKVVIGKPPNYLEIAEKFTLPEGVLFTYGDTVYASRYPSDHVIVHEAVHVRQQNGYPEKWWHNYLKSPRFRQQQEVEAYRAQWDYIKRTRGRQEKRNLLEQLSRDLASPMYALGLSRKQAKELIDYST